jgi:hypothetical protein
MKKSTAAVTDAASAAVPSMTPRTCTFYPFFKSSEGPGARNANAFLFSIPLIPPSTPPPSSLVFLPHLHPHPHPP